MKIRPVRGKTVTEMQIYRLKPSAPDTDPSWELSPGHGEIIVRAKSSGDARQVAAEAETDFLDIPAKPGEGVSTIGTSAFRNNKLYTVIEDNSGEFPPEGPRGVLSGHINKNVVLASRR